MQSGKFKQPEVLFEYEGWTLKGMPGVEEGTMWDEVYHKCEWKHNWFNMQKSVSIYHMDKVGYCGNCGADIPEEFQAIWKLKNFSLLQKWHQNEAETVAFYMAMKNKNKNKKGTSSGGPL